jgi:hypothetical protein
MLETIVYPGMTGHFLLPVYSSFTMNGVSSQGVSWQSSKDYRNKIGPKIEWNEMRVGVRIEEQKSPPNKDEEYTIYVPGFDLWMWSYRLPILERITPSFQYFFTGTSNWISLIGCPCTGVGQVPRTLQTDQYNCCNSWRLCSTNCHWWSHNCFASSHHIEKGCVDCSVKSDNKWATQKSQRTDTRRKTYKLMPNLVGECIFSTARCTGLFGST